MRKSIIITKAISLLVLSAVISTVHVKNIEDGVEKEVPSSRVKERLNKADIDLEFGILRPVVPKEVKEEIVEVEEIVEEPIDVVEVHKEVKVPPEVAEAVVEEKAVEPKPLAPEPERESRDKEIANRGSLKTVPGGNTSMKSYMGYKAITSTKSPQYKLQHGGQVYTDSNGYRRVGDSFVVAVGTYYADSIGTKLRVTLDSGSQFTAIVGDFKANRHTDGSNMQHAKDGSVIEFIVDTNSLESTARKMGDCSYSQSNNFKGNVSKIEVLN